MAKADAPEEMVQARLDDRVVEILAEHPGRIAFNGLRRLLGAHPESLSRALRRLERHGAVVREDGGYALGSEAEAAPAGRPALETPRVLATVALPPNVPRESMLGLLAGRWFGSLRWFGVYDRPRDPWLAWVVPGVPGHVYLGFRGNELRVMVDLPSSDPRAESLVSAAYDLLAHAVRHLRPGSTEPVSTVLPFVLARFPGAPAQN